MENVTELNAKAIKFTNKELNNPMFNQALNNLMGLSLPPKTAYSIGYIGKKLMSILKDERSSFQKVANECAKLDEKGELIPAKDSAGKLVMGSFEFKDDESKEKFEKHSAEFMEKEHVINRDKISVYALGEITLTAADISVLEPLFSDLD